MTESEELEAKFVEPKYKKNTIKVFTVFGVAQWRNFLLRNCFKTETWMKRSHSVGKSARKCSKSSATVLANRNNDIDDDTGEKPDNQIAGENLWLSARTSANFPFGNGAVSQSLLPIVEKTDEIGKEEQDNIEDVENADNEQADVACSSSAFLHAEPVAQQSTSEKPFLVVIGALHCFRLIRVFVGSNTATVEYAVTATLRNYACCDSFALTVYVFGDKYFRDEMQRVMEPNRYRFETYEDFKKSDVDYVRFVFEKQKVSGVAFDECRIITAEKKPDRCSPLCSNTSSQLGFYIRDERFKCFGIFPLAERDSILNDFLSCPPPRQITNQIREACAFLYQTTVSVPRFKLMSASMACATLKAFEKGNWSAAHLVKVIDLFSAVAKICTESSAEFVQLLHQITQYYCRTKGFEQTDTDSSFQTHLLSMRRLAGEMEQFAQTKVPIASSALIDRDYFVDRENRLPIAIREPELQPEVANIRSIVDEWSRAISAVPDRRLFYDKKTQSLTLIKTDGTTLDPLPSVFVWQLVYENALQFALQKANRVFCSKFRTIERKPFFYAHYFLSVFSCLYKHVFESRKKEWTFPRVSANAKSLVLRDFWPYWLEKSFASKNSFAFADCNVLTGTNASGKSTLLRSITAIALLANCGFMVPCADATVPEFDEIILCATSDCDFAKEGKSAFDLRVEELNMTLVRATVNSLVCLDNIGDGTSERYRQLVLTSCLTLLKDKSSLAVVTTHSPELITKLVDSSQFNWVRMLRVCGKFRPREIAHVLEQGVCTDSDAVDALVRRGLGSGLLVQKMSEFAHADLTQLSDKEDKHCSNASNINMVMVCDIFLREIHAAETLAHERKNIEPAQFEIDRSRLCKVDFDQQPPAAFANRHCVYLRQNKQTSRVYVGETDDVRRRIEEHRLANKSCTFVFYVVAVPNKSVALTAETQTIRSCRRLGVLLDSEADGHHRNGRQ